MESFLIRGGKAILGDGICEKDILLDGEKIGGIFAPGKFGGSASIVIDASGLFVSPGFVDIHTHGGGGYDFMDGTAEAVYEACRAHLIHGTTTIFPTSMAARRDALDAFLTLFNCVEKKRPGFPEIAGIHLEGPYLSLNQAGAQDPGCIRNPDKDEYENLVEINKDIKRWSFAVELPNAMEFLDFLACHGIVASAAHTDADCQTVLRFHERGLSLLTHFYSGMRSVVRIDGYRSAGAVEAGYLSDSLYVEIIADGHHLPPDLLKLIYKVKGFAHTALVTDSMRAAGMPDGNYYLGPEKSGVACVKEGGVAKLPDRSAFAGSVATMDVLVRNMVRLADVPLHEAVAMASLIPARIMGIESRKGSLAIGHDADVLIFDGNVDIKEVFVRGERIRLA